MTRPSSSCSSREIPSKGEEKVHEEKLMYLLLQLLNKHLLLSLPLLLQLLHGLVMPSGLTL